MKHLKKILVPTDLSENSRRGLRYASALADENRAALLVLYVANELDAWELYGDDLAFLADNRKAWPKDRVLSEANLDLNRFLEPHLAQLKNISTVVKRIAFGPIPYRIATVAEEERADLIVMSPRRRRGFRHLIGGGVTDRVTRMSPCPVLSITAPLSSQKWRGKQIPALFGWPAPKAAEV